MSMFDTTVGNYSVRYQLRSGSDGLTTLHVSSASVTLHGLAPNAEYTVSVATITTVSVAGINSCGGTSTFAMTQFNLQGMYVRIPPMFTGYQWDIRSLHHLIISTYISHVLDQSQVKPYFLCFYIFQTIVKS